LSKAKILQLITEYSQGAMAKELAIKYKCHRHTINAILDRHGVKRHHACPVIRGKEQIIVKLYESGLSSRGVAEELGVSQNAVLLCLHKQNIAIRPTGQHKK
jgi:transposase